MKLAFPDIKIRQTTRKRKLQNNVTNKSKRKNSLKKNVREKTLAIHKELHALVK